MGDKHPNSFDHGMSYDQDISHVDGSIEIMVDDHVMNGQQL